MTDTQQKMGIPAYVIAGLSFIPLFGVLPGLVAVFWGLASKKTGRWIVTSIGLAGICCTIAIYGSLFHFALKEGGGFEQAQSQLSSSLVTSLVASIEFYKLQNDDYPESLEDLSGTMPENSFHSILDPIQAFTGGETGYFYYENLGDDGYRLFSVGPDGEAFTDDDIHPEFDAENRGNMGLRSDPP